MSGETDRSLVETMSVSQARQRFSETLNRVHAGKTRVVIEKNGIPVAAIVPMVIARIADERERHRVEFQQVLANMRSGFVGIPEEEVEREIERALDDIKRERRLARRIVQAIGRVQPDLFEATDEQLETTIASVLKQEEGKSALAALQGVRSDP